MNIGDTYTDGTAVFKVKSLKQSGLVGKVEWYAGNSTPAGYLLCDGSAVNRTDYDELFTAIGTTYGTGDGSTTFNLPNLIGRFAEGSATAGTEKSAGLPNITGNVGIFNTIGGVTTRSGAFLGAGASAQGAAIPPAASSTYGCTSTGFDASKASSIYGNSTTVQPNSLSLRPIIKYA